MSWKQRLKYWSHVFVSGSIVMAVVVVAFGVLSTASGQSSTPIRLISFLTGGGDVQIVDATNPVPVDISAGSPAVAQPATLIADSVSCAATATQLPANAVATGAEFSIVVNANETNGIYIGGSGVTAAATSAFVPVGGSYRTKLSNTDKLVCLCDGCTQVAAIIGEAT